MSGASFLDPEDMSDEDIQQLISLGIIPEKQDLLKGQLTEAQALRDRRPEMRSGGRTVTAANPLEFITQGMQSIKSQKEIEELRKQQNDLLQKQVTGRSAYLRALMQKQQGGDMSPIPQDPMAGFE